MFAVFNRRSIQNKNVVPNILNPSIEAMPYFNSFCSFCSVRLGSIVVGILSFVQDIAPAFIMISMGPSWFSSFAKFTEDYIKNNGLDDRYLPDIRLIDKNKDTHFITFATLHVSYLLACILEVIGAFIINKWLLLPFILLELVRLIFMLAVFCTTMIMIKKAINLGLLITISCIGMFALLFLGYLWSCVVSLFQIIFVVNSGGYRGIYGSNPLKPPPKPLRNKPSNVEKVKFFSSPTNVEKLKSSPESKNHRPYPTGLNNSQRLKDDYLEMRRKYLKKSGFDIGHGQTNSRF